jgi:hypothetical protein
MSKKQRVIFTFDERSLESLKRIKDQGHFDSLADTVRESLRVSRALQAQGEQGYTEVVVRNPKTKEERVIIIPTFHSASDPE